MRPDFSSLGFLLAGLAVLLLHRLFTAACSASQSVLRREAYSHKERRSPIVMVSRLAQYSSSWAYSNYFELSRLGERADRSAAGNPLNSSLPLPGWEGSSARWPRRGTGAGTKSLHRRRR
jgi:hypothetical protein